MSNFLRPLGIVKEIVEGVGTNISYNYDDLVFIEHNPYLVQFSNETDKVCYVYFNEEIDKGAAVDLTKRLQNEGFKREMDMQIKGYYKMVPNEETKELNIQFMPGELV